jgi:hypothetical protein
MSQPIATGQRLRLLRTRTTPSLLRGTPTPADTGAALGTIDHALPAVDVHASTRHLRGHLEALAAAPGQLRAIRTQLDTDLQAAEAATRDPNLSNVGRSTRRAELIDAARQRAADAVAALQADAVAALQADAARHAEAVHASATLPPADPGVEAMMNRDRIWQRQRTLLESGAVKVPQLIAEANDPETLHALLEELPIYVRSKGVNPANAERTALAVEARLAAVTGGDMPARYAAHAAADVVMRGLEPVFAARGGGGMNVAVASQAARSKALGAYTAVDPFGDSTSDGGPTDAAQ